MNHEQFNQCFSNDGKSLNAEDAACPPKLYAKEEGTQKKVKSFNAEVFKDRENDGSCENVKSLNTGYTERPFPGRITGLHSLSRRSSKNEDGGKSKSGGRAVIVKAVFFTTENTLRQAQGRRRTWRRSNSGGKNGSCKSGKSSITQRHGDTERTRVGLRVRHSGH